MSDTPALPEPPCPADELAIGIPLRHRYVHANGVRFHVVEAGHGPLVLLLHGFPEFWYAWRSQIPALTERFTVVAPDLRGYNLTEKPSGGYDIASLARDVAELIAALGAQRAHVVGHDWGGVLAWGVATLFPDRVERLAVLNAPHPGAYFRELRRNPRQALKSWYVGMIQVPGLVDAALGARNGALVARMLRRSAVGPSAFSANDLAAYRRAATRPGALPAMLAYYRALPHSLPNQQDIGQRRVAAPTLLIWGMRDVALVPDLSEGLERWVPNLRVERITNAGHWVQHEQPARVNRLLLDFLDSGPDASTCGI